jgi:thiamine pyrophosphokinase
MKRISIVANGHLSQTFLSQIQSTDFIIGVDRAAYWLIKNGIVPNVAIGDFDSVNTEQLTIINQQSVSVIQFPPRKDATDLELAIDYAISLRPKEVLIMGVIGTRLDHSFVAIQLLEKFIGTGISAGIRNEKNECMLCDTCVSLQKNNQYKYFSLLPVTNEIEVSLSGCAYPLKKQIIHRGVSLGISNEITSDTAMITIHKGLALIIRSSD